MKKISLSNILGACLIFIFIFLLIANVAKAETVYCIADKLNGRYTPNIKSERGMILYYSDEVEALKLNDNGWVEIIGGESGTVWCKAEFLSVSIEPREWKNISNGSVNIRKAPSLEAKICGRVKKGRIMRITAEVLGWGYIKDQGWVDLNYFALEEPEEVFAPIPLDLTVEED